MSENDKKIEKSLPEYWADFLIDEVSKETDRAAVILTVSLFENALTTLLKGYLAPTSSNNDELFDGPTAPLSNFSSKIQIAHRLGLISQRFTRDLNIIRKMRNEFAHNVHGSNLESGVIKDLLTNLVCSSDIINNTKEVRVIYPDGAIGDFLSVTSLMLFHLHQEIETMPKKQIKGISDEWVYSYKYKPSAAIQSPQSTEDKPTE